MQRSKIPRLVVEDGVSDAPHVPDGGDPDVQVWHTPDGAIFAYCWTRDGRYEIHMPGVATFCFDGEAGEVRAITHRLVLSEELRDTYRRQAVPLVLQALGNEVLHASAVVGSGGVVAFCADAHTGKSTIAYGLSRRGYPLWADDAVALQICDRSISAIPLPFVIRLRPASAAFFGQPPTVAPGASSRDGAGRSEPEPAPVAALCVLARGCDIGDGAAAEVRRLSSSEAFLALLTHAYCFSLRDVERNRRMMQHYLALATGLPIIEIRFRPGLEMLSSLLDTIERAVSGGLTDA